LNISLSVYRQKQDGRDIKKHEFVSVRFIFLIMTTGNRSRNFCTALCNFDFDFVYSVFNKAFHLSLELFD